ncbi:MAG: hypothetical protein CL910_06980 [Deltaproteobacteria bacterium]|jgi:MFS family permease|nr:hypothetical protein [Deltaproteobacteria bacterium]
MDRAHPSDALFVAYRACTRFMLIAPYFFHYATSVRGLSPAAFGWITAVYYVTTVVLELPSGILADRFGRRRMLVAGAVALGLGSLLLGNAHDLLTFVAAEMLFAIGTGMISGADSALLYDRLADEGRPEDYPRIEGAGTAAWLLSTALAMPLADLFLVRGGDPTATIWFTAGAQGLAVLLALTLREPARRNRGFREITLGAMRNVVRVPGVARWIAISVGVFVLIRAAIVLVYNPVLTAASIPVERWGTLLAGINLLGGLAAWQAHRVTYGRNAERLIFLLPVVLGAMYLGIAFLRTPAVALLFGVQGIALGLYPVAMRAVLNRRIPEAEHRATVLSIESLACRLGFAATALVVGSRLEAESLGVAIAAVLAIGLAPIGLAGLLRRSAAMLSADERGARERS